MDPGGHRSWPHQAGGGGVGGGGQHGGGGEPAASQGGPPRFGPGTPQHQAQQSPPSAPLPPPGSSFPPYSQPHSLANLAGISQSSPRQPPVQSHRPDEQRPPPGFGLPSLSQATGQPAPSEREQREAAERIHIKEEEDRRHREQERLRLEQAPQLQAPPGPPVHLHQPVAVGPRTVHGPNGLLGNPAIAGQAPSHMQLGAPTGPPNIFAGGPVQPAQGPALLTAYGPGVPAQAAPPQQQPPMAGQQQQGQGSGQQPILNDALSYLDQVKVQFADQPDVYNRFLDIMKDFKSGAIDTPGVIGRVSTLFAGNPDLIQGFNTFLPHGYRIECGHGDDPNAIRVTTPMGTTVSSMPQPRPLSRQEGREGMRPANGTFTPQPGQSAPMMFSPSGRPVGPAASGQHLSPHEAARQQEQQAIHQQQQRGVNQLQDAVSVAAGAAALRAGVSPRATPMPGQDSSAMVGDANANEKRGPVEFNHAISYVNKIKNRFSAHPDIYKQFLEILQTYQRESKPIQDVYSQVTRLFSTAPDLLEDFKQFLPESAAHAKQVAERARLESEQAPMSDVRGERGGMYGSPTLPRDTHIGTPGHGRDKLPPVGNFAPTPASKDNKRKRGGTAGIPDGIPGPSGAKQPFAAQTNKRLKTGAVVAKGSSEVPTSPTLIPALPAPLEPTTTSAANSDELTFFDKARKTIGNKNVMNEFLKLCNLFSQDLIERGSLIHRAHAFIGSNADLMKWFTEWVGEDARDIVVQNTPRVPSGRVMLSNCRGLGPSYRLLPKRERQKPCSGRDELCHSVLNDDWASHPTWASEDSGFIAHRKNVHEEGLHRIEEERHDYDFNIETCSRTIQLLEPIATQLRRMDDQQQRAYVLPNALGGQSETIYKRVIMKLYGREKGSEVIHSLHDRPYQVIPVLLNRLKERLESWKLAQREWEKVWREQTQKMFWKSLDHQAADQKKNDRRQFINRTLQQEIQVKHEEMKRAANVNPAIMREPQMEFTVDDPDVLADTAQLILAYVEYQYHTEFPKLFTFVRDFVPLFFGLDITSFRDQIEHRLQHSPTNESADDLPSGGEDSSTLKSRKPATGKNGTLLRAALDRGRKLTRKEDSNASGSRASTPEIASNADEDMAIETVEDSGNKEDVSTGRWLDHPVGNNKLGAKDVNPHESVQRNLYRCWANTPIYCFIRLFVMLYERLYKLKIAEANVREAVQHAERVKPAIELGIVDKLPHDFFADIGPNANYYGQMLEKFESVLRGELDFVEVEDSLRRFYLQSGYAMYPMEKIVQNIARDALAVMNGDNKDKSAEVFALFRKDRLKENTTAQQQHDYRKSVEKMVKDSEIYRIEFVSALPKIAMGQSLTMNQDQLANKVRMYIHRKDDPIGDDGLTELDRETRWRYYIASYTSMDNTDGIEMDSIKYPFLLDNLRAYGADPRDESFLSIAESDRSRFLDVKNEEKLNVRIAVNSYRIYFQPDTFESFHATVKDREHGEGGTEGAVEVREVREDGINEKLLMNNEGMKDLSKQDVEGKNTSFADLIGEGVQEGAAEGEKMDVDGEEA